MPPPDSQPVTIVPTPTPLCESGAPGSAGTAVATRPGEYLASQRPLTFADMFRTLSSMLRRLAGFFEDPDVLAATAVIAGKMDELLGDSRALTKGKS